MGLAAAERDRPYITGFFRAPQDFPGIFAEYWSIPTRKKPDRSPARGQFVYLRQPLRRYSGDDDTSLFPLVRGLAILLGLFGRTGSAAIQWAPAGGGASATPPVTMGGRWRLVSANGGACGMTFGARPTAGTIAPEGGCPANFFTSRHWVFEQGSLVIQDHTRKPLITMKHNAAGRFEGELPRRSHLARALTRLSSISAAWWDDRHPGAAERQPRARSAQLRCACGCETEASSAALRSIRHPAERQDAR